MERIGNLNLEDAKKDASSYGYNTFLCGLYRWSDYASSGRDFTAGKIDTEQEYRNFTQKDEKPIRYGKFLNGVKLPQGMWYNEDTDIFIVTLYEDYGQGQSSTAYFSR